MSTILKNKEKILQSWIKSAAEVQKKIDPIDIKILKIQQEADEKVALLVEKKTAHETELKQINLLIKNAEKDIEKLRG